MSPSSAITLETIREAASVLRGLIVETPTTHSRTLSEMTGAEVWLKHENLQFTASFKERGALVKLLSLTSEQRDSGVIAASAGNHALAVAYHTRDLGIPIAARWPGCATPRTANIIPHSSPLTSCWLTPPVFWATIEPVRATIPWSWDRVTAAKGPDDGGDR